MLPFVNLASMSLVGRKPTFNYEKKTLSSAHNANPLKPQLKQHPHSRIQALEHPHLTARCLQLWIKLVLSGKRDYPTITLIVFFYDRRH